MSNLPTAEEFLKRENLPTDILSGDDINYAMIEFAKLHCEAQAKEIVDKAKLDDGDYIADGHYEKIINKDSILNAYPLTNIK